MNYQRERWTQFFHRDINDAFHEFFDGYVYNGIKINCTPDASQVVSLQRQGEKQEFAPLYVTFSAENENNNSQMQTLRSPVIKLMEIPFFAEDGFKGKEATIKPVSRLSYASGWYIDRPEKSESGYSSRLVYRSKYRREFYFTDTGLVVSQNTKEKVPVLVFLKALTGYSYQQLMAFYPFKQIINYVFAADREPDRTECCNMVFGMLYKNYTKNATDIVENLENLLFNSPSQRAGNEKLPRYLDMESFHRFHGFKIKKIVSSEGIPDDSGIVEGAIISESIATKIDNEYKVHECVLISDKGMEITVKRNYADGYTRNLCPNEVLYAYYQYLLFMNGIGSFHDGQELSNLILEPIDRVARRAIEFALISALKKITENINNSSLNPFDGLASYMNGIISNPKESGRMDIISIIKNDNSDRTMDITNILSETDMAGKVKKEKSDAQRDVHPSHYGRIDMNDTPESAEVGHTVSLCAHSDIDEFGFITVPMYKVTNGKVDKSKIVYVSYLREKWSYVAPVDVNLDDYEDDEFVPNCTLNGQIVSAIKNAISYQRRQAEDYYGSTLASVPLITSNGVKRFSLASSGFKQATPLLAPERPYVTTGFNNNDIGVVRARDIIDEYFKSTGHFGVEIPPDVTVKLTQWNPKNKHVEATFTLNKPIEGVTMVKYTTLGVSRSITNTMRQYKLASGDMEHEYYRDEIVFYSNDVNISSNRDIELVEGSKALSGTKKIKDHDFALGQNVRVLYKTFEGYGYEDSVQFNERFVNRYGLATVFTSTIKDDNSPPSGDKQDGKLEFTKISNHNGRDITWLDDNGLPKLGSYLKPGDVAIGKVLRNDNDVVIAKPKVLSVNQEGYVWYVDKHRSADGKYDVVEVILAKIIPLDVGDKVTGGHGNKATCSRILKESDMPYFEDGTTPDIIFDPLGCIARENAGQITECLLGEIGRTKGKTMVINHGTPIDPDNLLQEAEENGIELKTLYNPRTGEPYKEKAFIGTMYMVRSTHTCFSKYMAMGSQTNRLSVNLQPTREGAEHAQRMSEQTTWWYRAAGGEEVLNSLFTVQSDDIETNKKLHDAIIMGEEYGLEDEEGNYNGYESMNGFRIQAYTRFFGLNVVVDPNTQSSFIEPISTKRAEELFGTKNIISQTSDRDVSALSSPEIFGETRANPERFRSELQKYGLIKVSQEYISPVFLNSSEFTRCIPTVKLTFKKTKYGYNQLVEFCGLTRNEVKAVFNHTSNGNHFAFGTINEETNIEIKFSIGKGQKQTKTVKVNNVFFLVANDFYDGKVVDQLTIKNIAKNVFNCNNLDRGAEHFFTLLADENLYDLKGAYEIYKEIYYGYDISYEDSLSSMSTSEEKLYKSELKSQGNNNNVDYLDDSDVDSAITQASAVMDMARLEEMLFVTGYTLKSFMTQYVVAPPMILRPIGDSHNPFRAFTKVLMNILNASTSNISDVYDLIERETKQKKKSRNPRKQSKTVIQEFTSHNTKTSVLRDLVLAKPVSYSGRSVISVDPTLTLGECKAPAIMLVTIFKEHLIKMVQDYDNTTIHQYTPKDDSGKINKKAVGTLLSAIVNCDLSSAVNKYAFIDNLSDSASIKKWDNRSKENLFLKLKEELYDMLIELSKRYPMLLSRDPALWELSIRGHKFIPSNGYTIRIHPLVCMGFNADFDGDQMSGIFAMHGKARKIITENMMVGQPLINPQEVTSVFEFAQDVLLGHFFATSEEPDYEGIKDGNMAGVTDIIHIKKRDDTDFNHDIGYYSDNYKYNEILHLYDKVDIGKRSFNNTVIVVYDGKKYVTTVGRLMFNLIYPTSYVFLDTPDEELDGFYKMRFDKIDKSKSKAFTEYTLDCQSKASVGYYTDNSINEDDDIFFTYKHGLSGMVLRTADRLMKFGFASSDLSGTTLSYWDFTAVRDKRVDELVKESTERADEINIYRRLGLLDDDMANENLKSIWNETQRESERILSNRLAKSTNLFMMITSGARGSISNLNHICGFIGTVVNTKGEEMPEPIKGNFLKGLTNEEMSINSFNGISVKIHTQQGSSKSGESMRNLVYLLEHFRTTENTPDGDKFVCDAAPTVLELIYDVSYDTDLPIIFSKFATSDMNFEESSNYYNFIRSLTNAGVDLTDSDVARSAILVYGVKVIAIEGSDTKIPVTLTMCKEHKNMLRYRTVEPNGFEYDYRDEIINVCAKDITLTNGVNYILTDKAIDIIEKYGIDTVSFYTMINCESHDGTICPRCFGYRYEDFRYPDGDVQIGYTVAGAISQRGLQSAQNLHKSGGNSKRSANIYSSNKNKAFTAPVTLNSEVNNIPYDDIFNIYTELVLEGKFDFGDFKNQALFEWFRKHYGVGENYFMDESESSSGNVNKEVDEFKKHMSSVACFDGIVKLYNANGMTIIAVVNKQTVKHIDADGTVVDKTESVDFIWFPLWNQSISICVADGCHVLKGDSLIRLPAILDMLQVTNTATGYDHKLYSSNTAMTIWYTVLKAMTTDGGFAARNFELTTKAFTEVGTAQESNHSEGIIAGRDYPIYMLENAKVKYASTIPSNFNVIRGRGKVFSSMALGHFLAKAASCSVMKTVSERTSSLSDAVVGIDRYQMSFPTPPDDVPKQFKNIEDMVTSGYNNISKAVGQSNDDVQVLGVDDYNSETSYEPEDDFNGNLMDIDDDFIDYDEDPDSIEVVDAVFEDPYTSQDHDDETDYFDNLDLLPSEDSFTKNYPKKKKKKDKANTTNNFN